ncbi:DUF1080 domain-containing protein [Erysipelotrichaceae bacterium AF15-26LB]|nr:GH32 C-terminal domain-containing protein [[Clostridium] innocuum]RJV86272.1 DUF1080 domain-containing protein [Erysipelotrichaceae bacterium AF15-26LB]RJV87294.1 DUF1080 domain-containing protein [Erysipelotrichaceae bacterium AF19-24AC]
MRWRFLGQITKLSMCTLLAVSGMHMEALWLKAAENYQNNYTQKFSDEITLNKTDGDNMLILDSLGSYEGDVTFEADMTLSNPDDEQSAGLIFGIKDEVSNLTDANSLKANIHNKVGEWAGPARVWGDDLEKGSWCEDEKGPNSTWLSDHRIDVTKTIHMKLKVENKQITYTLQQNSGEPEVMIGTGKLKDSYTGGRLGIMTFKSTAVFSNIKVNDVAYGTVEHDGNGFAIRGLSGDSHTVNEALGMMTAFTYEADVAMNAGQSAALTFGIKDKDKPEKNWFSANFDGQKARVFHVEEGKEVVNFGEATITSLDMAKTVHMKLDVDTEGNFKYYLYNKEVANENPAISGKLEDYTGGYLGALTFNSSAAFSNVTITNQAQGLTSFTNIGEGEVTVDEDNKTVTLSGANGDHFAMYDGLSKKANDFKLEADVQLTGENSRSAALVFGASSKTGNSTTWYGANFDKKEADDKKIRVFGGGMSEYKAGLEDIDLSKSMHLCIDVKADGNFTYTFGNSGESMKSINGKIPDWKGGFVGLLTFDSEAVFSNVAFENRTDYNVVNNEVALDDRYHTNLNDLSYTSGTWEIREDGLYSNAAGKGDSFLYTKSEGANFVYRTDVKFHKPEGAAALVFRSTEDKENKNSYAVNIDGGSGSYKFWRWQNNDDYQMIDSRQVEVKDTYKLEVVAYNGWISYYLDGQLVGNTGDYTIQNADLGQSTYLDKGYFGLLNFNGEVSFQNTYYKEFDDSFTPLLEDLTVTASTGTVEAAGQFQPTESVYMQYVSNEAATVNLKASPKSSNAVLKAETEDGKTYSSLQIIPVKVGKNIITVTSTVTDDNCNAALTYKVIIIRRKDSAAYYNEEYRDQYHYSVKEGWANDPNGLVYYNGKYHMFYQFYSDTKWGPMHWAHATSTDLLYWEEQPIAFYPDENGSMFSGCIVVDEHNTSGLFGDGNTGGLVALITANGNGQRIKLAYSTDEGKTWKKTDKIVADWSKDPLNSRDFRDPKVFRWEGKWFMVVAGGPLRIYSSENLLDWKVESTYKDLHTECPDLYPIKASDGKVKWVLSRGGRYYKVGDFKEDNGKWKFVADSQYEGNDTANDGIMNFGKDSYAAMTYYVQDFGTEKNPTLPKLVELNWMNTWDDYCNSVADKTGNDTFNGTFNLNLTLGLTKAADGKYVLTQKPVKQYETLRGTPVSFENAVIEENNNILKDFKGDTYEIVANLKPDSATHKVGFKVRTGNKEETVISYDISSKKLSIDRSRSGIILSDKFAQIDAQTISEKADGSIDLHIFVDKASVEVFANDYTVAGANQIFPTPTSLGAEVFSIGGKTKADITIYPLDSIWKAKEAVTDIQKVGLNKTAIDAYVQDSFQLNAYVLPVTQPQDILWSVSDPTALKLEKKGNQAEFTALKEGTVTITAASAKAPSVKAECKVTIRKNALKTNLDGFKTTANGWHIDGEKYIGSIGGENGFTLADTKAKTGVYTYSADIRMTKGIFNMIMESQPDAFAGSYAVQLRSGEHSVRLFDFRNDHTFAEASMKKVSDSGEYHIDITKDDTTIIVRINGETVLTHTIEAADRQYSKGLFGFGIYNAEVEVSNIYVRDGYPVIKVVSVIEDIQLRDDQKKEDAQKLLPEKVRVEDVNGVEKEETITWNFDKVAFQTPGAYDITGVTESGLSIGIKAVITTDQRALQEELKAAEAITNKKYTEESWNALKKAIAEAKRVTNKEFAHAAEVKAALQELKAAVQNLKIADLTISDKKAVVQLIGDLPENVELHMKDVSDSVTDKLNANSKLLFQVHQAYDIELLRENQTYQPDGTILLRLKLSSALMKEKVYIAYLNERGDVDVLKTTVKDGYAQAEITHFSVYAIVTYKDQFSDQPGTERPDPIPGDKPQNQDMQTPSDAGQAENPEVSQNGNGDKMENVNTGDNSNTAGLAALCLLSITGVILLRRRRKAD